MSVLNLQLSPQFIQKSAAADSALLVDNSSVKSDEPAQRFTSNLAVSVGTYMMHSEIPVPQLSESPFSTAEDSEYVESANWNFALQPFGLYRSIFHNGSNGNYQNFYNMFSISEASPFYASSIVPQFYSDEGTCDTTTFVPSQCAGGYEEYRPFVVENRGYTRSYFFGIDE